MTAVEQTTKKRDYKRLLKVGSVLTALGLIPVLLIGLFIDAMFYSIVIYVTILVSIIGYVGGIWLWEYLATSELIKGSMKRLIKLVGIFVLLGFVAFISFSVYTAFYGEFTFLRTIVTGANYLLLFMFSYFIGYLLSIWYPATALEKSVDSKSKFKLDWAIIKRVLKIALPICAIGGGIMLGIGIIEKEIAAYLVYYGIFLFMVLGFCLGYLIWEHLKKSNLITGDFQNQLKGVSILATIALGGLTFYGLAIVPLDSYQLYQELILYYSIFLICMFFYFLGLYVSVLQSK